MKKPLILVTSLVLLLSGALAFPGCGGPRVVKIGVIAELTGSIPAVGASCKNGTALAVSDLNEEGGVKLGDTRYEVELSVKDCANDPEKAASAARELIEEGAVAIVGPNATANALPAADEAETSHVVLVTPWSTSPRTTLTAAGKPRKYVYRVCVTASYEGREVAGFARGTLASARAAVLYDQTADVIKIQAGDFRKDYTAAGGTVVAYEGFEPGGTDYSAQLSKILAAAPDLMFVPAYYNDVPVILGQVRAAGFGGNIVGNNGWSSPDIIDETGFAIEDSYIFNMYSPESNYPETNYFVGRYQDKYGSTPDDVAALSYDALKLVAKGLEKAGEPDRDALGEAMLKVRELKGASGAMRFTATSRDPVRGAVMLHVVNGQMALARQFYPKPVKADVVSFVKEAVEYAKANGKEKALAEFSDPAGRFNRGELYIYAYDFDGNVIAHGGNPSLVGKNLLSMKDPNGVMVIQELVKRAKDGSGWLDYMWEYPPTGRIEPKSGYVEKVDDTWWLGSGLYPE